MISFRICWVVGHNNCDCISIQSQLLCPTVNYNGNNEDFFFVVSNPNSSSVM